MRGSKSILLPLCVIWALQACLFTACAPRPKQPSGPVLSLDQGFEALFPLMSAALADAFGKSREPGDPVVAGAAVVVASPLSAARMLNPAAPVPTGAAEPRTRQFIVPFAGPGLALLPGLTPVGYDYEKAYAAMGSEAARRAISGGDKNGRDCAIVFQPNFMRGESALEAFSAAFAALAGPDRLKVIRLPSDPDIVDPSGSAAAAIREASVEGVGIVVLAMDGRAQASAATAAAGTAKAQALAPAKRRGPRLYFADASSWGEDKTGKNRFAYRIEGDEMALARATIARARALAAASVKGLGGGSADVGAPNGVVTPPLLVSLKVRKPFLKIF